ncbi:hydrogenase expression/formation protein HypE [Anaeromyxobacter paludicola]|uniref:Hydrogenase expression/formation protein HypE n=1 Tax=Anaeromyxobacter paludicola TaxID=2918171 RepID=A0ABM7X819_9BACT|nr:hydrogenase expression/formation protein HypE [Anaeromyxobacter paludicola]BDG07940.1 hydrogenase expression/formation protein HypE [Anaeromyxobacter paludicola]
MSSSDAAAPFGACPVPLTEVREILMGHGSGGKLTARLVEQLLLPAFRNPMLEPLDDQAWVDAGGARLAFTTDSYVVTPLFFPGGDIGEPAVNGTVNDLAMGGARPLFLSLALILEEGLALSELERVIASIRRAAEAAGVQVVTGDTKVVDRGKGDKVFVNTAGIGVALPGAELSSRRVAAGDAILLSGAVGDHGVTILSQREGLAFGGEVRSDTAPLHGLVAALLEAFPGVHAMRDPTRGGLASALCEIAGRRRLGVEVDERAVPVHDGVRGACELLGLDPFVVANEGKLVAFVPEAGAERALAALRSHPLGREAARIGRVVAEHPGFVTLRTPIGGQRILDLPYGESLPRIC